MSRFNVGDLVRRVSNSYIDFGVCWEVVGSFGDFLVCVSMRGKENIHFSELELAS